MPPSLSLKLQLHITLALNLCALANSSNPQVDYAAVAQKVGIKYAKNAKQSFKKVWAKLKSGNGGTAANGNGVDADDANDIDAESPKKPAAKKDVTPKKAPGELAQ